MLVEDSLLIFPGFQIGVAHEQGDFVVGVQIFPQLPGEIVDVRGDADPFRLSLKGGNYGIAVADIGVEEMPQTGDSGVFIEEPGTCRSLRVGGFQDGQLIAAVPCLQAGNAGRPVGAVVLKLTGTQGGFPAFTLGEVLPQCPSGRRW